MPTELLTGGLGAIIALALRELLGWALPNRNRTMDEAFRLVEELRSELTRVKLDLDAAKLEHKAAIAALEKRYQRQIAELEYQNSLLRTQIAALQQRMEN